MAKDTVGLDSLLGHVLGHYRLVERIGQGGMGIVYRAFDEHFDNREVAIKILPEGLLADHAARQRFRKEANTLSKLNHPNIASVIDFDCCDGIDFLAEELVHGVSLDRLISRAAIPEKRIIRLGLQLCEALAAAHEHGVIHRDIKPENLRVTTDGQLKILDFGLAKWVRPETGAEERALTQSETQTIVGTLPYMSPEQLQNEKLDARTDIWSAGCVLYEMATRRQPFSGQLTALVDSVLHKDPVTPLKLNPNISETLETLILKCLEKDPDLRYQSAKEIVVDLRRLSTGTVSKPLPTPIPRPSKFLKALKGAIIGLVAVVAAVAMWRVIVYLLPRPSIAVLPFVDMSPDHSQEYLGDGLAEETLNYLAKIPKLRVAARTSSFQFKGRNVDLREVGQKLGVGTVLEGSVRKDGNRLRITAQLIKVADGFHIWSESYDRQLRDVISVQDEIARAVAAALKIKLVGEVLPSSPPHPATPEAYEAVLQARYLSHRNDPESGHRALDFASLAIQLDPNYAPSYALRANILLNLEGGMGLMDPAKAAEQARLDTEHAITKDPNLAAGYLMLSTLQAEIECNCPEAEISLNKARELAPADPDNLVQAAMLAMCQGRLEESATLYKEALTLDPLRPTDHLDQAQVLRDLGKNGEAQAELATTLSLNPQEVMVHEVLGEIYLNENRPQEALAEMEKEPPGCIRDMGVTIAYHALGQAQQSNATLQEMIPQCQDDWAYQIAQAYAYRGETDKAFEWLDRAYQQHDPGLMWFKTDLKMKSLRSDPRYRAMLARLHLSE